MYKKIQSGCTINTNSLKQEIEQEWDPHKLDDTSGDINPCREQIVNNAEKIETILSQMEQWSILSNVVNYVQYNKHPKNFHQLNITVVNKEKVKRNLSKEKKEKHILDLIFWRHTRKMQKRIFRCI